jgi:1-aminocyclopropane-1-carboxylate deaminase
MFSAIQSAFKNITTDPADLFEQNGISVSVLRLDKMHPVISGNKWFKLQGYLAEAREQNKNKIVTFGGAYSNHIVATAAIGQLYSFHTAGIIRGEEITALSPTLAKASELGMQLYFINREDYRAKKLPQQLQQEDYYLVNEGGYGTQGAAGAATILNYATCSFTHCCCAVGTGTTLAGLIRALSPGQKAIGISAMKNNDELEADVLALTGEAKGNWQIIHDYHFGGYAKYKPGLIRFMNDFFRQTAIPSDFVYTGKLFYGVADLIKNNFFPARSRILIIHSGGLQGNNSLEAGTLIF